MRLTAKAETLRAPLKSVLADIVHLVDPPEVPLAHIRATMADYPAALLAVGLQAALARSAPEIDLVIQPWRGGQEARLALIDGSSDLALSVFPGEDPDINQAEILREDYVIALREGHPSIAGWTGHMSSCRAAPRHAVRWTGSWPNRAAAAGWGWWFRAS